MIRRMAPIGRAGAFGLALMWAAVFLPNRVRAELTICVGPGHGGADPGSGGCGLQEANVNFQVSLRLRDLP